MGIVKSTAPALWLAGLMFIGSGAAAQTTSGADPNCPLPGISTAAMKLVPGKSKVLSVAKPGSKECPGGLCQMDVEVQSYTKSAGTAACCVRAEYASFVVKKSRKDVVLRWNLSAKDRYGYVFNPVSGVEFISPQPNPGDFDQPKIQPQGKWFEIPSLNGRAQDFNYGFTIFRKDTDGTYLRCDPNDPLIVNEG